MKRYFATGDPDAGLPQGGRRFRVVENRVQAEMAWWGVHERLMAAGYIWDGQDGYTAPDVDAAIRAGDLSETMGLLPSWAMSFPVRSYKPSPAVQEAMRRPRAAVPAPARAPLGAIVAFVAGHAAVGLVCLSIVSGLVVMLGSLR